MSVSPSLTDIIAALRKSGYLMEQEVATQLEALNLHVWTNWAFEDSDEGKSREIDVRALRRVAYNEEKGVGAFIEIIAECKNNSNPLVFIGRPKNEVDGLNAPQEVVFPAAKFVAQRGIEESRSRITNSDAFFRLGFDQVHHDFAAEMKAVQFCQMVRKGNWQATHGGLYDSIFYPIVKALMSRKREILSYERRNFWFFVPIVVTSGDIYYVNSTATDPVPKSRDYVTFKREIRSGNLNGTFAIDFVRQNQLERFYWDCLQPLVSKMIDLTNE